MPRYKDRLGEKDARRCKTRGGVQERCDYRKWKEM